MVNGYTTTDEYPYSQRLGLQAATADSASPGGAAYGQPGQLNYVRNSVKAVVNAYTGAVTLYQWDTGDPVLRSWMKAFGGIIKPRSAIPAALLAHLRYPEALFGVQRQILASYHVRQAQPFYGGQNFWTVPARPPSGQGAQPPYYLTMSMPGYQGPDFSLTTSFVQRGRPNMAAYMAVDSNRNRRTTARIQVLDLPQAAAIPGPEQVQNSFETDPTASIQLSQLRRGGSRVTLGNLVVLPVGGGFLYIEPVYVESSAAGSTGSYPPCSGCSRRSAGTSATARRWPPRSASCWAPRRASRHRAGRSGPAAAGRPRPSSATSGRCRTTTSRPRRRCGAATSPPTART